MNRELTDLGCEIDDVSMLRCLHCGSFKFEGTTYGCIICRHCDNEMCRPIDMARRIIQLEDRLSEE
jgi:hypothetical protein